MGLDEMLSYLAVLGFSVDPVYPSSGLMVAYRAGIINWNEALSMYLCFVPCQRIGREACAA